MAALPTTNITTTLVANTLGVVTRNVGELCTSSKINMWSKRKPVRDTRLSIPVDEVGVGNLQNSAENYGLIIPAYQGDDSLLTTYKRPTGGPSYPYRLGDFRGYDHNAVAPVIIPSAPASLEKRRHTLAFIVPTPGGSNVTIGDIFGFLGELRIGVMVYESGSGLIGAASSSSPGGTDVRIDLSGLAYSSLDLKFCLTDYYKSWDTPGGMTALYEIPRAYPGQNQNWINIPLVDYVPPTEVSTFNVSYNPFSERLEIQVQTKTYTGPILITYKRYEDDVTVGYTTGLSISEPDELSTFYESNISWLVSGKTYKAILSVPSGSPGTLHAEDTFTAFMIND